MESFSYERDTFFVEVGGHNRHRRATVYEIQELLHPSISQSSKDPAGHWYEAQCIHYGLRSSKTKSVAKTRLLDALNGRTLKVPETIQMTEEKLRKKWHKDAKEKLVSQKGTHVVSDGETSTKKRKAPASSEGKSPKRKKIEVKKEEHKECLELKDIGPAHSKRSIQTARRGKASTTYARGQTSMAAGNNSGNVNIHINTDLMWQGAFSREDASDRPQRPKQTARCNRGGSTSTAKAKPRAAPKKAQKESQPPPQRRKQTARRVFSGLKRDSTVSARDGDRASTSQTGQHVEGFRRSKQTARRSRGWRVRAGRVSGRGSAPSRFESTGYATHPENGYGSHDYFECEAYENEEYQNEYDSYVGYSNEGYADEGYSGGRYSNEGYYNDEYPYERSSNEDYGTEFSVPIEEEEEDYDDYYDHAVAF